MSPLFGELLEQALHLDDRERAVLAARLIDSLDQDIDADAEALWDGEIARRMAEAEAGDATMIPWPELRLRLMRRIDEASAA